MKQKFFKSIAPFNSFLFLVMVNLQAHLYMQQVVATYNRLNRLYQSVIIKASRLRVVFLILLMVAIDIVITGIFSLIFHDSGRQPSKSWPEAIFGALIFAPVVETWFFQQTIINYVLKKRPGAFLLACLSSAVLFGAAHCYSVPYIFKAFIAGLLYATLYLAAKRKKEKIGPYLAVMIPHFVFNLIGLLLEAVLA